MYPNLYRVSLTSMATSHAVCCSLHRFTALTIGIHSSKSLAAFSLQSLIIYLSRCSHACARHCPLVFTLLSPALLRGCQSLQSDHRRRRRLSRDFHRRTRVYPPQHRSQCHGSIPLGQDQMATDGAGNGLAVLARPGDERTGICVFESHTRF